ncbi:hypothetical protein BHE74_00039505 [Ensete ventricosum]|nr:hypothetical protein GW17_00004343 [Ensete ventricosum]RWW53953.1 hypothetical protein BHE74_00039505 [Ensete ventricosum]
MAMAMPEEENNWGAVGDGNPFSARDSVVFFLEFLLAFRQVIGSAVEVFVFSRDNPLHFAFPLLIVQTTIVLLLGRSIAFLLKPLRQPKVIAEIVVSLLI